MYEGIPDAVYRPAANRDSSQIVMATMRDLKIRADFPPVVRPDKEFHVVYRIWNTTGRPRTLVRVGIGTPQWVGDSLHFVPYARHEYHDLTVGPKALFTDTLSVTLSKQQMRAVPSLHVSSWDALQSYDEWIALTGMLP